MAKKSAAEDAVRNYLNYLQDPDAQQPDTSAVDKQIKEATDPIEKLRLDKERRQMLDVEPFLRGEFIKHAKQFADDEGLTAESFQEVLGVERSVLAEAGLVSSGRSRGSGRSAGGDRKSRVKSKTIEEHILGLRKGTKFKTSDIVNDTSGSPATVSKVIKALEAESKVEKAGKDDSGSSRPAQLYAKA